MGLLPAFRAEPLNDEMDSGEANTPPEDRYVPSQREELLKA